MDRFTITSFHSYKGGTGKTSTILNVAAGLALAGLKVGILDLDIEAPGFAPLYGIDTSKKDLLQLLSQRPPVADIDDHIVEIELVPNGLVKCLPCSGSLDLIDSVDWMEATTSAYLRDLTKTMQTSHELDHLLLDTRSGASIQAAFGIQQADQAVITCRLDRQNRYGVKQLSTLCRERGIASMIVANAVPDDPGKEPALKLFKKVVGMRPQFQIPYDPSLYFEERIVVSETSSKTAKARSALSKLTEKIRGAA